MKRFLNISLYALLLIATVLAAGCSTGNEDKDKQSLTKQFYRCPMHHEIVRDKPGSCPICGMDLVPFGGDAIAVDDVELSTILRPTNSYVLSNVPVVSLQESEEQVQVNALGVVSYDTRFIGSISARISGRIEKLYLKYTFQDVSKGQKVMDIYSPEIVTAEQDLLFLMKNDPANTAFMDAAKEKLLLLGMSNEQLQQVIRSQKLSYTMAVYSNYSGHIHDALPVNSTTAPAAGMNNGEPPVTKELVLKEGMYVQKGQTLFSVYNPHKLWAILNIYADDQGLVKVGNDVQIMPEAAPDKKITAKIGYIEPFFREESKTLTARVYFENHAMNMSVGSQVKATITRNPVKGYWLPADAVVSLGLDKVVFKKLGDVFKASKVKTGLTINGKVQVLDGLTPQDAVASNAQFLMDSESFIKTNE